MRSRAYSRLSDWLSIHKKIAKGYLRQRVGERHRQRKGEVNMSDRVKDCSDVAKSQETPEDTWSWKKPEKIIL